MKTLTLTVFVLLAGAGISNAQGPPDVIAYDSCQPLFYWSPDGDLQWTLSCDSYLMTVDGSRNVRVGDGVDPAVSPDGRLIALVGDTEPGIFVVNLSDWSTAKVSDFGGSPAWSPDGMKLAFVAGPLSVMAADGSGVTQLPNTVGWAVGQPAWSPDGLTIAYDCEIESGNRDICSINVDGTGFVRLTSDPTWDSSAAFSPDGLTIAFVTGYDTGLEIAVMATDGSGVNRTGVGNIGAQPAWSLDRSRIAYVYFPEGVACNADGSFCWDAMESIHAMNADGTDRRMIARGTNPMWALAVRPVAWFYSQGCDGLTCSFNGWYSWGGHGVLSYSWNFGDGTTATGQTPTHAFAAVGTYSVTLTVTDELGVVGTQTRDVDVVDNAWPTASFTYVCSARRCTFDPSGSFDPDGPIASYFWSFGDGTTSSADTTVSHTYSADGAFTVRLTVADNAGGTGTQQQIVHIVNAPPAASFTKVCTELTCTFNGSGSSDPDGTITSYTWNFGDGTSGSSVTAGRTYAAGGTYTVTLTVTDNGAASSSQTQSVTVVPPEAHVGDLDRARTTQQNIWTAFVTITVHDSSHSGLANAVVSGSWNGGSTASCTTNASGQCTVSKAGIPKKSITVSFSVTSVARAPFVYNPAANHDPDGDSNGITISVMR